MHELKQVQKWLVPDSLYFAHVQSTEINRCTKGTAACTDNRNIICGSLLKMVQVNQYLPGLQMWYGLLDFAVYINTLTDEIALFINIVQLQMDAHACKGRQRQ